MLNNRGHHLEKSKMSVSSRQWLARKHFLSEHRLFAYTHTNFAAILSFSCRNIFQCTCMQRSD